MIKIIIFVAQKYIQQARDLNVVAIQSIEKHVQYVSHFASHKIDVFIRRKKEIQHV